MPPNITPEWQKVIRELLKVANQVSHGEIVIQIHERKPVLTSYTVKRKTDDTTDFTVRDLDSL